MIFFKSYLHNNKNMNKFKVEPQPGSILGSLRSIGYDLKTALSDIIDNSIAAKAEKIEIINNDLFLGNI